MAIGEPGPRLFAFGLGFLRFASQGVVHLPSAPLLSLVDGHRPHQFREVGFETGGAGAVVPRSCGGATCGTTPDPVRTLRASLSPNRRTGPAMRQSRMSCALFFRDEKRAEVLQFEVFRSVAARSEAPLVAGEPSENGGTQ